jgi:hypothetical protein
LRMKIVVLNIIFNRQWSSFSFSAFPPSFYNLEPCLIVSLFSCAHWFWVELKAWK